jgi:predicted transcriptional regulator YdeE
MTPTIVLRDRATAIGIGVNTSNAAEMDQTLAKIPMLWARFYSEGILGKIPAKKLPVVAMGIYTDYESDHNGPYRLVAGAIVEDGTAAPNGFAVATLPAGKYLKFTGEGEMPGVVIDTWEAIWSYFSAPAKEMRAFSTDFEVYCGPETVDIYIAVR